MSIVRGWYGFLAGSLVLWLIVAVPLSAGGDPGARLAELQKQMEDAVSRGQAPPPGLLEEMQQLLEELMNEEGEDRPGQESNWVSVPFQGRVTIRITGRGSCSIEDGGSFSATIDRTATAVVQGCREVRNEEGEIEEYIPQGTVQTSVSGRHEMVSASEECTLTAVHLVEGSDRRTMGENDEKDISLLLDPERRVYTIDLPSGWADVTISESITGCGVDEENTFTDSVAVSAVPNRPGGEEISEYAYSTGFLHGDYSVPGWTSVLAWDVITGDGLMPDNDPLLNQIRADSGGRYLFPVTVHVSWDLNLEGDDLEAVIEPLGDYGQWLPVGGVSGAGAMVKARVRIVRPEGARGYINFRLVEVSQVKGRCMNEPLENPDTGFDLKLNKGGGSSGIWIGPDGQEARTENEVNEATVAVQALDFGAWGRLEAEVRVVVKGQARETRAVFKARGTDWLAIPRDDDEDHVADAWAEQMQIEENGADDNDPQPGRRYPGDGLSVYEEYRGFIVQGRHLRTDPKVKDLFIWDPDELVPRSRAASGAFGPLVVHTVTADEIRTGPGADYRVINLNDDPDRHVVDQHGLFIYAGHVASSGYTFESLTNPDAKLGPPVLSECIEINESHILKLIRAVFANFREEYAKEMGDGWPDEAWVRGKLEETVAFAIAHEISHGIGVCHHHPDTAPPYSCLMSQPEVSGTTGYCSYNIFKGDYSWGGALCEDCLERIMVSDIHQGQGYLPPS